MEREPLPENEPEYIMINAMRRVMEEFRCVQSVSFKVVRGESFEGDSMSGSLNRKEVDHG